MPQTIWRHRRCAGFGRSLRRRRCKSFGGFVVACVLLAWSLRIVSRSRWSVPLLLYFGPRCFYLTLPYFAGTIVPVCVGAVVFLRLVSWWWLRFCASVVVVVVAAPPLPRSHVLVVPRLSAVMLPLVFQYCSLHCRRLSLCQNCAGRAVWTWAGVSMRPEFVLPSSSALPLRFLVASAGWPFGNGVLQPPSPNFAGIPNCDGHGARWQVGAGGFPGQRRSAPLAASVCAVRGTR